MTISEIAVETCRVFKRENLCSGGWVAMNVVYMEWLKMGEIKPISDLPKVKKLEYWKMTPKDRKDNIRVMMVQALYVYDLITSKFN